MSLSLAPSVPPLKASAIRTGKPHVLPQPLARRLWLQAQGLDRRAPFGGGAAATPLAVAHLGYVQIDTINVIERSHHHILFSRIPDYRRAHLHQAQTVDKTVFEYWTHALSYLPFETFRFYVRHMRRDWERRVWHGPVTRQDPRPVLARIRRAGALPMRDFVNEPLWGQ